MRLIVIGLTLALAASAPPTATAQAPVMTQPLAPGEVLLEVNALGFVTTRADQATMSFTITGSGETEAAALTSVGGSIAEIRAMLRGQGIADADIRIQPATAYASDTMEAAAMNAMTSMEDENATITAEDANAMAAVPGASANAQTEILVRNVDRVPAIQSALMERGIYATSGVVYALNDESVPRRQARTQAMQKARADAEAYAASLNMRVARVVRVTERLGLDLLGMAANESRMVTQIFSPGAMRANGAQVPTTVVVGVDFALAPR
jgi:uncharacterized protein YggE